MKKLALIGLVLLLSGCAATYTYEERRYGSKEEFLNAVDKGLASDVAQVTPLPKPITNRTLVFGFPTERTAMQQSLKYFSQVNNRSIGVGEEMMLANLLTANMKGTRAFYEAIKRKNIYTAVKFVEMDSMTADFQASPNEDVLYWNEAARGAGQWYYTTTRSGKQAFAFDRGGVTNAQKTNAFLDAVQVFAIR